MKPKFFKSKMVFIALSFLMASNAMAQNTADSSQAQNKDMIFNVAEQMPEYVGGLPAMYQYIANNVRYPDTAKNFGIQGRVRIKFVVDEKGVVRDVKATTSFGFGLEEEALRVIRSMPKWKPAYNKGVAVKCYFIIPIKFTLDSDEPASNEPPTSPPKP